MSSLMGFLSGGPKKTAAPSAAAKNAQTTDALQKISDHIDILDKKAEHLTKKADAEKQQAVAFHKKGGAMNKRRAMQHLKMAKQLEGQINNQFKMQDNLIAQKMALENTAQAQSMISVMSVGATALSGALDRDKVDDLVGDMEEAIADQQEVTDILTRDMGLGEKFDEDDLNAEMEELLNGEIDLSDLGETLPDMPSVPGSVPLPSVPTAEPVAQQSEADAELAALQAFAM